MIVLDIETSGTNFLKCGIWQIGAYDLETGEEFLDECRIDNTDKILNSSKDKKTVFDVTGKTEADFRDKQKQSQRLLLKRFFKWIEKRQVKNFLCQNPVFDVGIITNRANKYKLEIPFHHRSFDLHNIAQLKFFELNRKFLMKEENKGDIHSDMGLKNILEFCGMQDNRKAHNALEDCKLTAECFSRLRDGKNLFPEYSQFSIPEVLKK